MFFIILLGTLMAIPIQAASADEVAVRQLVATYVEAREQRDTKRLSAILAPNADQLVSSGEWRRGRDELIRGMLESSGRNSGARTIEVEDVRFIAPGIAIANGRYEIAATAEGQKRTMWTTFIVARTKGVWRIEAIRNMLPAPNR